MAFDEMDLDLNLCLEELEDMHTPATNPSLPIAPREPAVEDTRDKNIGVDDPAPALAPPPWSVASVTEENAAEMIAAIASLASAATGSDSSFPILGSAIPDQDAHGVGGEGVDGDGDSRLIPVVEQEEDAAGLVARMFARESPEDDGNMDEEEGSDTNSRPVSMDYSAMEQSDGQGAEEDQREPTGSEEGELEQPLLSIRSDAQQAVASLSFGADNRVASDTLTEAQYLLAARASLASRGTKPLSSRRDDTAQPSHLRTCCICNTLATGQTFLVRM